MRLRRPFLLFLSQFLPATVILLAGLALAWRTGQADPWNWGVPALLLMAPAGWWLARWGRLAPIWAGLGVVGMVLVFCATAATRMPDPRAAAGLGLVVLLASAGGAAMRGGAGRAEATGGAMGLALIAAAVLLCWLGPARPISTQADRPGLAVISALPLFWQEGVSGPDMRADAPIVTILRSRFDLHPIDDPRQLAASGAHLLLLAQPRAMPPAALVALDGWVRRGNRVMVLTDRHLRWPSALPLGDRRRPPAVGMLDPLLAHWGVEARALDEGEVRHFLPDGRLLTLSGATALAPRGVPAGAGPVLRIHVGRGEALLVGDADLLDDRLWLSDPGRPLDMRAWSADTPQWIVQGLGAQLPGERRWFRQLGEVHLGLRSAFLVGTGWAMLGLFLLGRGSSRISMRTKHENMLVKGVENG